VTVPIDAVSGAVYARQVGISDTPSRILCVTPPRLLIPAVGALHVSEVSGP
jgi:hypothetical protein